MKADVVKAVKAVNGAAEQVLAEMILHFAEALRKVERAVHGSRDRRVGEMQDFVVFNLDVRNVGIPDFSGVGGLSAAFGEKCGAVKENGIAVPSFFTGQDGCLKGGEHTVRFI